jgi:hypothetical protein
MLHTQSNQIGETKMKVLEKGHIYQPALRRVGSKFKGDAHEQKITFINKEPGSEHDGTTTQEVIRILIDRTRHCANCMPHPNNERIVYHLRMALVLHEARALERKVEKGEMQPEYVNTGLDGHFNLDQHNPAKLDTPELIPHRHDWDRQCNHPVKVEG